MEMRQKVSDYRFASFGERAGKWASQSLHMYMHMCICIIIRAVNRALVIAAFSFPAKFFCRVCWYDNAAVRICQEGKVKKYIIHRKQTGDP